MKDTNYLLPYSLIVAAAAGDAEAINRVLRHYEGYIATLSTRRAFDNGDNPCFSVDEWMRRRLETKLIARIVVAFNVA